MCTRPRARPSRRAPAACISAAPGGGLPRPSERPPMLCEALWPFLGLSARKPPPGSCDPAPPLHPARAPAGSSPPPIARRPPGGAPAPNPEAAPQLFLSPTHPGGRPPAERRAPPARAGGMQPCQRPRPATAQRAGGPCGSPAPLAKKPTLHQPPPPWSVPAAPPSSAPARRCGRAPVHARRPARGLCRAPIRYPAPSGTHRASARVNPDALCGGWGAVSGAPLGWQGQCRVKGGPSKALHLIRAHCAVAAPPPLKHALRD
jgi:hypothetical protein